MIQDERQTALSPAYGQAVLLAVVAVLFLPFLGKPFNVDDPLFLWAAQHIRHNPLDFYGFDVNWYRSVQPMALVMKNPPLFSYYLAGVGTVSGWGEAAMHLAMLVPLAALALGTFRLAGQLHAEPLQAAIVAICTPVVMVSGTTLMCDVPMVALWVWAVSLWLSGSETPHRPGLLLAAAGLVAAAGMTKYFGASLVPLLAAYSLARRKPLLQWVPYLLIPVAVFLVYEYATDRMYGVGLLSDAFSYSAKTRTTLHRDHLQGLFDSLSFTGGGLIVVMFLVPLLLRLKGWAICGIGAAGVAAAGYLWSDLLKGNWAMSVQQGLFIVAACVLLGITAADFGRSRGADSLLLGLWILGTFLFAGVVNWTVSERNILPMAPAAGIIISRRLLRREGEFPLHRLVPALLPALLLSVMVTVADYRWAREMAAAVGQIAVGHSANGKRFWFQGHWGFQYYMERMGAMPLDFTGSRVQAGELFATPSFGSNIERFTEETLSVVNEIPTRPLPFLAVMNMPNGAGFYSSDFGPLPYVFGPVQPERYIVGVFRQNISFEQ